ncbi:hypothetical protein ACVWYN_000411 [Pedobacter sp. UYP24]
MENQKKSKSLLMKVLGGALFAGLFILNVMVFVQSDDDSGVLSLSTLKAYALSGSSGDDGSGSSGSGSGDSCNGCPAGQSCVEGLCVVKEKATSTSCTESFFCWKTLSSKTAYGHKTTCPSSATGSTNCAATNCDAVDPC